MTPCFRTFGILVIAALSMLGCSPMPTRATVSASSMIP
jgi:hypothetical protein